MNIHSIPNIFYGDSMIAETDIDVKSDKYNQILDAAIKVFAQNGFHNSTVSQIAKEAGVADGTIYLYFKNKDDILKEFFKYKTKLIFEGFRGEVEKAGNAVDKLRNLVHRHLGEFQNDINMAITFQAESRQSRRNGIQIDDITKMYLDIVGEIVEQGQMEGTIRKNMYASLVKRFILGAVDEVIHTWVHAGGRYDLLTMADPLVDLYLRGIGSARFVAEKNDTE